MQTVKVNVGLDGEGVVRVVPSQTVGQKWTYMNTREHLEDVGRVYGNEGLHILLNSKGQLITIGGYWLARVGETWEGIED